MDTEEINAPDLEVENAETEQVEAPEAETETEAAEAAEEDGPLVVSFGEDEPEAEPEIDGPAPEWVKELRKLTREQAKRIKELEQATQKAEAEPDLGPKPTLEGCDYDPEVFEARLESWHEQKREVDAKVENQRAAERKVQEKFDRKVAIYNEAKTKLPVDDFDDAEEVILKTFNETQQGVLVHVAKNPALLAYALGKNPSKAKMLAAIDDDPLELAAMVREVELSMKQVKRAPAPEKRLSGGSAPGATGLDNRLEKLREEAAVSGDYSKVRAYKATLRS
jgi:hypothetical protein